jgi:transcriptional regulator with XRE-family HTH domain
MKQLRLAVKVLKERQRLGLSIRQFAKKAGIDPMTVFNIEEGKLPSVATVLKLSKATGKPAAWFLE